MFGERPSAVRDTPAERAARAPYLAACVLGRAAPNAPPEVLSAYLHPCVSEQHLMLVDSDLERIHPARTAADDYAAVAA